MIVVDTNVVSELMKPSPSPKVTAWAQSSSAAAVYTTSITLAEIRYGIERLPDGARKERLRTTATDIFRAFDDHVLAFDAPAAEEYAKLVSARERDGAPIDGFDAQIAAICRRERAALATRNTGDFSGVGISLVDPWR